MIRESEWSGEGRNDMGIRVEKAGMIRYGEWRRQGQGKSKCLRKQRSRGRSLALRSGAGDGEKEGWSFLPVLRPTREEEIRKAQVWD